MNVTPASTEPQVRSGQRAIFVAGTLIVLAALTAYANSFFGAFVFDDGPSITDNLTVRHLWPAWNALSPPHGGTRGSGLTVSGRPVLNFSFALNYAWGGVAVPSYHVLNVFIHALAGLTLFGLARRTLGQPVLRERFGAAALPLAFTITALWTLHPLQTEAVTYIVQRAESLMSLFYLLTLYFFLRGTQSPTPRRWQALAIAACLLGMGTKENMVSAPVLVLLFDRAFVAGNFAEAWRLRWRCYIGLAATWLLLAALLLSTGGNRSGSVGFNVGTSWWDYALTQFPAIIHYLRLSFWPHPLVFDYGTFWIAHLVDVALHACVVAVLVGGTLFALWRKPELGFLGVLFFAVLAPTSLVPGTTQMIVEHRMYLPLAVVATAVVVGLYTWFGRVSLAVCCALAVVLAVQTFERNCDYRTEATIWRDTVAKRPDNARAHHNLGRCMLLDGQLPAAIEEFTTALRLEPDYALAHDSLGVALAQSGRVAEAILHFEAALRLRPDNALAHYNLGNALLQLHRISEAVPSYEAALRLRPDYPEAHNNLAGALEMLGRVDEARAHYEAALRAKLDYDEARKNLERLRARP